MELVSTEIENYCRRFTQEESPLFKELVKETYQKMEMPEMQVGQLEGAFLRLLVRLVQAQRVLEIGTFTGYSSLCMAEALNGNGSLITCDIDPIATSIAQKYWDKSPFGRQIILKLGPALDTLRDITGSFDLVFIDADKENYIHYWESCVPKVRVGGLIIADNVLWSGRVLNPQDSTDKAISAFNEHVSRDPRVEKVMLSVRDGMTLAVKTGR